jgi:glycosyltransferase EpsD
MKKILFVANIHKHFMAFHIPYIIWLKGQGYEVHVAANDASTQIEDADKQFIIPISRKPLSFQNIKATIALKRIIEQEQYCLVHCHTAIGSVTARLAAKSFRKNGLKVLYTAHGLHFYKGSPMKYWLLYYPVEKYLSNFTDAMITINEEDYQLVRKKKFNIKHVFLIPSVGLDTDKFKKLSLSDKGAIRTKNGYTKDVFLALYIAEFIPRKNHAFLINAVKILQHEIKDFKIVLAGRGEKIHEIKALAQKLGVVENVGFLGFRKDIGEVIMMCDIGISVSKQEGLPMNIAEQMYAGNPILASNIRGHKDLVEHQKTGFLFKDFSVDEFVEYFCKLYQDKNLFKSMSRAAKTKSKKFELENSLKEMQNIYNQFLDI